MCVYRLQLNSLMYQNYFQHCSKYYNFSLNGREYNILKKYFKIFFALTDL